MNAEIPDGDLVRLAREDDPVAFRLLVERHQPTVRARARSLCGNLSDVDDVVQESFLRAWNRSAQLDENYGSVGPWLVMIARHSALDYLKSSHAQLSAFVPVEDAKFPAVMIDHEILESDRARLIQGAFRNLSENQRQVIQLAFYEGLSQTAIAERLHQPLGTVKGWARSALTRLRGKLDPKLLDFTARH